MATEHSPAVQKELTAFENALRPGGTLAGHFDGRAVTVVRVPARLDVMGGIADYSGANVCQLPLANGVVMGIQKRKDEWIRVVSAGIEAYDLVNNFAMHVRDFYESDRLRSYEELRALFADDVSRSWAAYVVGSIFTLLKERALDGLPHGLTLGLMSSVPMNVGIGSSATVEVATLQAVNALMKLNLKPVRLAHLGQVAENRVVGAPCGLMDQIATACGQEGSLLHILCRPDIVRGPVAVPEACAFVGVNSMVKHSVGGAKYTSTRVATFMGRRILFQRLRALGHVAEGEEPFGGYLCNIGPDAFRRVYREWLPRRITGKAFLSEHETTEDPAATVDPKKTYVVEARTSHPIYENARVLEFIDCLRHAQLSEDRRFLVSAGETMYGSHWSYARLCAQSCPEVDFIVRAARDIGPRGGVFGAKITGGGSGGTVALMLDREHMNAAVDKITAAYRKAWGHEADIFRGTSPGACAFGSTTVKPT